MKMLGSHLHLAVLLFTILPVVSIAQSVERPKPGFTLSIEDDKTLPEGFPFGYHRLLATFTNVTDMAEDDSILDRHTLNMIVLYDGAPAEETALMRQERKYRDALASGKAIGRAHVPSTLKPGESVKMPLYISDYFDTSKPGTYTITVNQETYPWEPAKSVTVWSNTLTIVVPKPEAEAPQ
jgi:hypothetical protein